jgi:AcrR family transcriptional regulator
VRWKLLDASAMHKRESIVFTTIDLINEFGIQAISTREVAKRQGISQGTVFQYFKKKSDLLNAVLDHYSLYDNDIFQTTILNKMEPKQSILFYIDTYLSYFENYPAITAVSQAYDILRDDPILGDKVKGIYDKRSNFIKSMIEEAQQAGIICREYDSSTVTDILISTCNGICLRWRINNFNFPLREKTLEAVNILLSAFNPCK